MSTARTDPLLVPVRVVPEVDGVELLFMAAVGAASLSLRVLLDAVARAASRHGQEAPNLSRLAFVGFGFALAAARSAGRIATGTLRVAEQATSFSLDAVPSALRGPVDDRVAAIRARDRERQLALTSAEVLAEDLAMALVPRVVAAFLDQLDLTAIVEDRLDVDRIVRSVDLDAVVERIDLNAVVERIDLNEVAERIDVDAVAARLDVEALVERLDLAGLARTVIDEIDLPEVIRRSTGVVASETIRGVRMQGIDADRAVASFVDRVLGRRQPRFPRHTAPTEDDTADEVDGP